MLGRFWYASGIAVVSRDVRGVLRSIFGSNAASGVPILYGGSVNPGNISDYMRERDVNGALVGGASLNAETFVDIVQRAAAVQS